MEMENKGYKSIETQKLEKIHYAVVKLIEKRQAEKKTKGAQFDMSKIDQLKQFLSDVMRQETGVKDNPDDLLGMHYYIAILNKLPLDKVKAQEIEMQKEIKRRRELTRIRLDAGNIENMVKNIDGGKKDD